MHWSRPSALSPPARGRPSAHAAICDAPTAGRTHCTAGTARQRQDDLAEGCFDSHRPLPSRDKSGHVSTARADAGASGSNARSGQLRCEKLHASILVVQTILESLELGRKM